MQVHDAEARSGPGHWLGRLAGQVKDLERLLSGLSEEQLARQPAEGKWSIKEIVCHLYRYQQVVEERLTAMLTTDNPAIAEYDVHQDKQFQESLRQTCDAIFTQYASERELLEGQLQVLSPEEWARRGRHAEFRDFSVAFQVEFLAHHEAHHIYQVFLQRQRLLGA